MWTETKAFPVCKVVMETKVCKGIEYYCEKRCDLIHIQQCGISIKFFFNFQVMNCFECTEQGIIMFEVIPEWDSLLVKGIIVDSPDPF